MTRTRKTEVIREAAKDIERRALAAQLAADQRWKMLLTEQGGLTVGAYRPGVGDDGYETLAFFADPDSPQRAEYEGALPVAQYMARVDPAVGLAISRLLLQSAFLWETDGTVNPAALDLAYLYLRFRL